MLLSDSASSASDERSDQRMDVDEPEYRILLSPQPSDSTESFTFLSMNPDSTPSDSENDSDNVDWLKFDEKKDQEDPRTLEEMERQLDEMLFEEDERKLWEIRMSNFEMQAFTMCYLCVTGNNILTAITSVP